MIYYICIKVQMINQYTFFPLFDNDQSMNDLYYEIEGLLNELPQRTIAARIQHLIFELLHLEKQSSPILEVERFFRSLIRKIELYYCRRFQKLDYFIKKGSEKELLLLRISKYTHKKPWRLEPLDFSPKKQPKSIKADDKNCNQVLPINQPQDEFDFASSRTSTPFSHYSRIPSLYKDSTLNQAIFLDDDTHSELSQESSDFEISKLQTALQQMQAEDEEFLDPKTAKIEDLQENHDALFEEDEEVWEQKDVGDIDLDLDLSGIEGREEEAIEFDIKENTPVHQPEERVEQGAYVEIDERKGADTLFQTHQSTKEILKYVEQFNQDCGTRNRIKSSYERRKPMLSDIITQLGDKLTSPQMNRKYRVRSSYQKELPQMRMKSNVSYENIFDNRTSKSHKIKIQFMPSPQSIDPKAFVPQGRKASNQQFRLPKQSQPQSAQIHQYSMNIPNSANFRLYKRFSQIKYSHSVASKRSTKPLLGYSLDKKLDYLIENSKVRKNVNLDYY